MKNIPFISRPINAIILFSLIILFTGPLARLEAQREYLPTPADLEKFYTTKTYVVLSDNPLSDFNFEIQDAVEKYWDITEYEFLQHDEFEERSTDPGASFLFVASVNFEKDKSRTRYEFLCLSLGGDHESVDDLKDLANLPLSYFGVDEDHYSYKLGILVQFLQNHVRLITKNPDMVTQVVYKHYNENMGDVRDKTLYLVEDELEISVSSESRISKIYPYEVKIVDREAIKELIMAGDEDAVILHKVGPEGKHLTARAYKILIGLGDAIFYYYDHHKTSGKNPDAFLPNDFKRLAKAASKKN